MAKGTKMDELLFVNKGDLWMVEQLVTSFFASAAFGIIFKAPKKSIIKCGFVGMIGWLVYLIFISNAFDSVSASLFASFVVGLFSQGFAKKYKMPVTIFIVCGIIPLVPGGLAYDAMRSFVENQYDLAIGKSTKTLLIAGSIALGLIFSEVINQIFRKERFEPKSKI